MDRRRRPARALLTVMVGVLGLACLAPRAQARPGSCHGVSHQGAITRIYTPTGHQATSYAVDPDNPDRLFVSDGSGIDRSLDGGCSWTRVYATDRPAPDQPEIDSVSYFDTVGQLVVPGDRVPGARGLVYATLTPCLAWKVLPKVPGCQVLVSHDDGATWGPTPPTETSGFPASVESIESIAVAPTRPSRVYMLVKAVTGDALYASSDGTGSWTQISTSAVPPLGVDPLQPDDVWAGSADGLVHSVDAGRSWATVQVSAGMSHIDVAHRPGSPAVVTLAYPGGGVLQSQQGGRWTPMASAPGPVTSIAHGSRPGDLAVTTDPSGPSAGGPFVYSGGTWVRIPGLFREQLAGGSNDPDETFYFADPNSPPNLIEYHPTRRPPKNAAPDNIQGAAALGPNDGTPRSCYQGPGKERAPDPPQLGPSQPAPAGEGPILVDNFSSGCLVSFDRFGHSKVLMQAPPYSEGVALTFDKQLVITTRFSSELTVTTMPRQVYDVLDADIQNVEGPTFDRHGNLFVEDNADNVVYEYPFPQYAGEPRRVVWSFGKRHFLEDMKIAPPKSPFAGDLLVQYFSASSTSGDGNPDAIAVLKRTRRGWTRLPDFARMPPKVSSLGMAFMPDGSVLVPDFRGSGVVWRFTADGKSVAPWANIGNNAGVYSFAKIDVTASGYVYVTAADEGAAYFCGADPDPNDGLPVKCDGYASSRNAIVRFDPKGNRLLPDFTENLDFPVGIAVPNVITGLRQILPPLPPPVVLPPGSEPPPSPHQPVTGPANAPAPLAVPAPGVAPGGAPAGQAQAQANPVSQAQPVPQVAAVPQQETQVQVAVATANRPAEQASADNPMTAMRVRRRIDTNAVFGGLLGGVVVLLGCASFGRGHSQPQPARVRTLPTRARTRRRRPR